jgi:hypothetical protein
MNYNDLKRKIDEIAEEHTTLLIICAYCNTTLCCCGSHWAQENIQPIKINYLKCKNCGKSAVILTAMT